MKLTTQQDRPGLHLLRDQDADPRQAVAHVFREADAAQIVARVNAYPELWAACAAHARGAMLADKSRALASPIVEAAREALVLLERDSRLSYLSRARPRCGGTAARRPAGAGRRRALTVFPCNNHLT